MHGNTPECNIPVQDGMACVSGCVSQSESSFGRGVHSGISDSDTYEKRRSCQVTIHFIYQTARMSALIQSFQCYF